MIKIDEIYGMVIGKRVIHGVTFYPVFTREEWDKGYGHWNPEMLCKDEESARRWCINWHAEDNVPVEESDEWIPLSGITVEFSLTQSDEEILAQLKKLRDDMAQARADGLPEVIELEDGKLC